VQSWMGEHKSLAALEEGEIIGAVVYDAFTPYDCCIHVRLDKSGCKVPGVLKQVFGYPFEQLGLTRITDWSPNPMLRHGTVHVARLHVRRRERKSAG